VWQARLHQAAPGCTRLHQAAPGCTRLHQAAPGCTRLHQAAPGCTRLTCPELHTALRRVSVPIGCCCLAAVATGMDSCHMNHVLFKNGQFSRWFVLWKPLCRATCCMWPWPPDYADAWLGIAWMSQHTNLSYSRCCKMTCCYRMCDRVARLL
jgi:hypothetical protein